MFNNFEDLQKSLKEDLKNGFHSERLHKCSAIVIETPNYYVLQSYNTIIACIDKNDNTLYDFLRVVYGYTATSAQHISKFYQDYSQNGAFIRMV